MFKKQVYFPTDQISKATYFISKKINIFKVREKVIKIFTIIVIKHILILSKIL